MLHRKSFDLQDRFENITSSIYDCMLLFPFCNMLICFHMYLIYSLLSTKFPLMDQDKKCIMINFPMTTTIVVLRSVTDFIYLIRILLQVTFVISTVWKHAMDVHLEYHPLFLLFCSELLLVFVILLFNSLSIVYINKNFFLSSLTLLCEFIMLSI